MRTTPAQVPPSTAGGPAARTDTRPPAALTASQVQELVAAAQGGDRDSFGMLYEEYRRKVFNLARFSLPYATAEDAVGETFVRAWAALPKYRDQGVPFVAWIYGIARHVVTDALRAGSRVELWAEPRLDEPAARDHDLDRLTLGAALDRLSAEQRAVIEMKYLAGLTNEEVGNALGKSPGAVNTQQWRALAALRQILEDG